ncbi:MAG: uracil-DNA glycosylase [Mariniblastus sp.]
MTPFLPPGWPVETGWTELLESHFQTDDFRQLCEFVETERQSETIYPTVENVFTAFRLTPFTDTKVLVLGQDPYHGPNQAHGLSFSVEGDLKIPPSLRNIYKELQNDVGIEPPKNGNLTAWAEQGVFMLNTVLTVRQGAANSHKKKGWERFTDCVIEKLNEHPTGIVFLLWGKPAEKKTKLIDTDRHKIIVSPHPSPLSAHRGFFGSKPFSQVNEALRALGREPIDWSRIAAQ